MSSFLWFFCFISTSCVCHPPSKFWPENILRRNGSKEWELETVSLWKFSFTHFPIFAACSKNIFFFPSHTVFQKVGQLGFLGFQESSILFVFFFISSVKIWCHKCIQSAHKPWKQRADLFIEDHHHVTFSGRENVKAQNYSNPMRPDCKVNL